MRVLLGLLAALALSACTTYGPTPAKPDEITALSRTLQAMSPDVTEADATRAARLAFSQSAALAQAYEITDPPLIHNAKVNAGTRPRGLCYHWAEDMEAAFKAAGFRSIAVTRAIANAETRFLIDHSTAVLIAPGQPMKSGVVIDPWRFGGRLYWGPVAEDRRYDWKPRLDVLKKQGLVRYAHRTEGSRAQPPSDLTN